MPYRDLKATVLDQNLCTSCGLCEVVCPEDFITMNGLNPACSVSGDESSCGSCNLCTEICPGLRTDVAASEQALFGRTRTEEERWLGIVDEYMLGRATDPEIYDRSASGGCSTALLLAARAELGADVLVVAARDSERPWIATSRVCRTRDDLVAGTQQSTYQLFPHLRVLRDLYREMPDARVALVALPCQVQALQKLRRRSGPVAEYARSQIVFILEIACSSNTLPAGTERLVNEVLDVPLDDVRDVRYREGEYPGDFVVYRKSGGYRREELWKAVEFFKGHKTHRCLSCGDWMSGLADVSLCDGDPNIFMASAIPEARGEKHGRLLIRTAAGRRVARRAVSDGTIAVVSGHIGGMNLGLERKRSRRATYERSGLPISDPPIAGYVESGDRLSDEKLLQISMTVTADPDAQRAANAEAASG